VDRDEALDELNLGTGATEAEIRAAHRALARERHPDVSEGDQHGTKAMQRLNQARDIALRHAKELSAESRQELVLRDLFEMQSGREAREAARDRGKELVAGTATVEVGRLQRLQRQVSIVAVVAIVAAATVALIRSSGSHGAVISPLVGALGVFAIVAGTWRSLLNEEVNRIRLSLDELGTELSRRQTYAAVFGVIVDGSLDRSGFEEEDLLNAVSLWMRGPRGELEVDQNGRHPSMIDLRELSDLTRASRRRLLVLIMRNDITWYRSPKGIKVAKIDLLRLGRYRSPEIMPISPKDPEAIQKAVQEALESEGRMLDGGLPPWSLSHSAPAVSGPASMRIVVRRLIGGRGVQQDPERRLRELVAQIGEVDVSRLILGKGLENGLLSESERVMKGGELLTTYQFTLAAEQTPS
jgi:hypothetical protein